MTNLEEFEKMLNKCNSERLGEVIRVLYNHVHRFTKRRLFCAHFPTGEPLTIVLAGGKEWSTKIAQLYQAWFARTIYDSQVPDEFEISHNSRNELISALVGSLTLDESGLLIKQIVEHICRSMSLRKDELMHELSLLGKLQEPKKSDSSVPLLEGPADSSTKCSNESESDDKTAT